MKAVNYMALALIVAFMLSFNVFRIFSLEEMSLFLTVIGLIYGLIAAFTITNAWERFSKIRDAIAEETDALVDIYFYTKQLSDKTSFHKIRQGILEYCKEVPTVSWEEYWSSTSTHKKFL